MVRSKVCAWPLIGLLVGCGLLFCVSVRADDRPVDYLRDIRPLLGDRCFRCHGVDENSREGGLRLDTADGALEGGDSGPAIVPGEPDNSELIRRILTDVDDERMPPDDAKQPLTDAEKQILVRWVQQGAEYAEHWAFLPTERPAIGDIEKGSFRADGAFDAWVMSAWPREAHVAPAANRYRLARRAALDLTGLPPDLESVERFVQDPRPDAWQRYVDRLMASPRYGERWAWPWLDAARYADSNGYQGDGDRTMWPWRDWVVDALNRGVPFDRWTVWQIAGDQLPEPTDETRLATGFLRNHMINGEGGRIAEENRVDYVMDMNETVGTTWLAMTLNCARCHDHKFDPISRRDYYQLSAFFNQTPVDGGGGNPQTPPVMTITTDEQQRQLDQIAVAVEPLLRELEQAERKAAESVDPPAGTQQPAATIAPRDRNKEQWRAILEAAERDPAELATIERLVGLIEQRERVISQRPVVMIMADRPERRPTYMLNKGLYTALEDEVTSGVPEVLGPWPEDAPDNRFGLARWLVEGARDVTARVAVNRVWQELHGIGLVKTAEDFGTQGEPPANAVLLDGLAASLIDHQWDTKWLVRELLAGNHYRLDSVRDGSLDDWDPANRLTTRGARHRMSSWMIRDQALAVSGLLVDRIGGPPVQPYQPEGVWREATFGNRSYAQGHGADLHRRSLYTFWRRIVAPTMFFDTASRQTCSVAVARTNTPLHALVTLNDPTFMEAARITADETLIQVGSADPQAWVEPLFLRVLIRPPSDREREILAAAFERHRLHFGEHPQQAEELLAFGETPSPSPALTYDPTTRAALTMVVSTLLNLDETLSKE
ncbi:MAG: PSD1 domain-containing protein [Planctomycetales bacterium]|nr:PSD1 domain-containing protein [Planctomycetales bacterium]